jgi:gas vesicle structural protein
MSDSRPAPREPAGPPPSPLPFDERVQLVELVDRVLDRGVVLRGDVTISVAGIDLIYLELRLLLSGVEALASRALPAGQGPPGAAPPGGPPAGGPAPGSGPPGATPRGTPDEG